MEKCINAHLLVQVVWGSSVGERTGRTSYPRTVSVGEMREHGRVRDWRAGLRVDDNLVAPTVRVLMILILASTLDRSRIHLPRIIQLPYEARFKSKYLDNYGKRRYKTRRLGNFHVSEVRV